MKTIGFIGAYDKIDLMLNVAKILTTMQFRVLIVDSTINQKVRYIVPAINPTVSYVTFFENIDVAVGFKNLNEVKGYLGVSAELPYDFILIDIDKGEEIKEFDIEHIDKNFFVTSFDIYSLKRGMEVLAELSVPINFTKILFAKEILKEEDDYLNYISLGAKVVWDEEKIYFPIENGDLSVISENQRLQKIRFRKLSMEYKESLCLITQQILDEKNDSNIRKVIKIIEKGA